MTKIKCYSCPVPIFTQWLVVSQWSGVKPAPLTVAGKGLYGRIYLTISNTIPLIVLVARGCVYRTLGNSMLHNAIGCGTFW